MKTPTSNGTIPPPIIKSSDIHLNHRHITITTLNVKPVFHGACFEAVSAPTLSARVPG